MDIDNIGFVFIGLNATYIVYNLCYSHLKFDNDIGPTLICIKRPSIWSLIFTFRFIIVDNFISNFLVVV